MGLYGVISYSVGQRSGEIGLRMALGSTAGKVVGLIVGQGMLLVGAGLVVGLVIAWLGGPLIASVLYGVEPTDVVATLGSIGTLAIVALLASLLPALRASRIDPAGSLRAD
jgi:ABC-type antimicrobial peptide transport system permease subunit